MKTKELLLAALAAMALPAQAEIHGIPEGVDRASQQWQAALNGGDITALSGLYASNAVVIPPTQEIISPEKIGAFWEQKLAMGTAGFRVHTINSRRDGDRVYQTSAWSATVSANGRPVRFDGEMTTVIARQPDGSWKIELQNWY